MLTGRQYAEAYLLPLAETDLIVDCLQRQTRVIAIGKEHVLKRDAPGRHDREEASFVLLTESQSAGEQLQLADAVIDCTGTYDQPLWMGIGGIPAIGERLLRREIDYHLPDILGADRPKFSRCHTLVVGAGFSAATSVVRLAQLAAEQPGTQVTWVTRRGHLPPLAAIEEDPLPERAALIDRANRLAADPPSGMAYRGGLSICSIERQASQLHVRLSPVEVSDNAQRDDPLPLVVDRLVAHVGYRPNTELFSELQVQLCYASEGPMRLAAKLLATGTGDCLSQPAGDAASLTTSEPYFYVLGSKSYGRNSNFLIATGLDQIRTLFAHIAGRDDLDLYSTMGHLLP